MRSGRVPPLPGKAETRLRDYHHARGDPGRCVIGGDEIAPTALPTIFECASAPQVTGTGTRSADGLRRMPDATAVADHALALALDIHLPKHRRARFLRRLGK